LTLLSLSRYSFVAASVCFFVINDHDDDDDVWHVAIGGRLYKENMLLHFVDIGKHPPLFSDAACVALELLRTPYEFDFGELYYNVFKYVTYTCSAVLSSIIQ